VAAAWCNRIFGIDDLTAGNLVNPTAMPYITAMQAVAELDDFRRDAAAAGMSDDEIIDLVTLLSSDPQIGDLMAGTGGARKFRLPGRGKGKRGGYRVITYFAGADIPVFLISVFAKGDRDNLSKAERNALRRELAGLAMDYRRSMSARITKIGGRPR
jgi:hypothetical protein